MHPLASGELPGNRSRLLELPITLTGHLSESEIRVHPGGAGQISVVHVPPVRALLLS
jgi:hypothetical protein